MNILQGPSSRFPDIGDYQDYYVRNVSFWNGKINSWVNFVDVAGQGHNNDIRDLKPADKGDNLRVTFRRHINRNENITIKESVE